MVHGGVLGRWVAAGLVAAALVVGAGGCGSSSHMNLSGPTTTVSAGSSTTVSATADDGQEAAILAAYRGSLADFNQVATTEPLNPDSPQLADHMAGDQLTTLMTALSKLSAADQIDRGQLTSLHATIDQFNGTQAVVASCEMDRIAVLNATTLKTVTPATNSTELVNALVTFSSGTWKVTRSSQVSPGCR